MDIFDYKEKELQYYVLGNIVVMIASSKMFQSFVNEVGREDATFSLLKLLAGASLFGTIMYVYTFLISSLFSGEAKIKLAYFKIGQPAGFTIFTDLMFDPKDMRILKEDIVKNYQVIYDHLPKDKVDRMRYENSKWYDIYHKHRDKNIVRSANREFLAFRDMTVMTVPILIGYFISTYFGYVCLYRPLVFFFLVELVATNIAMRKKCERLVKNVIAIDIRE